MNIKAKSAEQAFHRVLEDLKKYGKEINPRGKKTIELINYGISIENPRDRIISCPERNFSPAYAFGELIWYLTGRNDLEMMEYYSKFMSNGTDDGETLNSAYGYRIFTGKHPKIGFNQWENAKNLLTNDNSTRQAIIHLHTPNDKKTNDEVCTLSLQFILRDNKLDLIVTMRSNDIVLGFTYDVFAFTILQEMMANELGVELGAYHHNVGSMHIYENKYNLLDTHTTSNLPPMEPISLDIYSISYLGAIEEMARRQNSNIKIFTALTVNLINHEKNNFNRFVIASFVLKKLDKMYKRNNDNDIIQYQNNVINAVRKHNESYADILQNQGSFSEQDDKIIIEGIDGSGKSYLANIFSEYHPTYQVQHYCKPSNNFGYGYNYYHSIINKTDVIYDRFVFSEYIYGNVIRGESKVKSDELDFIIETAMQHNTQFVFIIAKNEEQKHLVLSRMDEEDSKNIAPHFDKLNKEYERVANYLKSIGANVIINEVE